MDAKLLAAACGLEMRLAELWAPHITAAMTNWGIDSPARRAMFLAQCAHESDGFEELEENLNYSAEGLARTWPNRYAEGGEPNALALRIARKPELIANYTYANRMGNGPPESGDGWKYRGRSLIGITGRDMYRRAGSAVGLDLIKSPELATVPSNAAQIAGWLWSIEKGCNVFADRGDIEGSTRAINGGLIGLPDRMKRWHVAKRVLGVN
jgi:putative chitinase